MGTRTWPWGNTWKRLTGVAAKEAELRWRALRGVDAEAQDASHVRLAGDEEVREVATLGAAAEVLNRDCRPLVCGPACEGRAIQELLFATTALNQGAALRPLDISLSPNARLFSPHSGSPRPNGEVCSEPILLI
jgi:hypothetical protein